MATYNGRAQSSSDTGADMAVTVQPAQELTELERIHLQMNAKTDASLDSTRRMVQYTQAAEASGANTLTMLSEQGEKLNRAEAGLDKINSDMKVAEQHVSKLEQCCCCCCTCPWSKPPDFESKPEYKATWESGNGNGAGNAYKYDAEQKHSAAGATPIEGNYIQRITNDAREDEMETNVRTVAASLAVLKNQANTMGNELERQNEQLGRMDGKISRDQERIHSANVRMDKIVGGK